MVLIFEPDSLGKLSQEIESRIETASQGHCTPLLNEAVIAVDNACRRSRLGRPRVYLGKKRYDGVIVQPIFGAGLVKLVKQAIAKGLKVGNIDQILGTDFSTSRKQVPGLAANVVFVPTELGGKLGVLTVRACNRLGKSPCKVGYIYGIKGLIPDMPVKSAFDKAIAAGNNIQVVAEGQSYFSTEGGLTATHTILQARPDLDVLVATDQSLTGAQCPIAAAGRKDLLTVGWGGSSLAFQSRSCRAGSS